MSVSVSTVSGKMLNAVGKRKSPQLKDANLTTNAFRVNFLSVDPSGQYETGDVITWSNKLTLRNNMTEKSGKRLVELLVSPTGNIRFTLDGSEPREGTNYTKPVEIGDGEVLLRVFAESSGLETKKDFRFEAKGIKGVHHGLLWLSRGGQSGIMASCVCRGVYHFLLPED